MLFFQAIAEYICKMFNNCERDRTSGLTEIRAHNRKVLQASRELSASKELSAKPNEYTFYIYGRPGSGIGTPSIARFNRFQIQPQRTVGLVMQKCENGVYFSFNDILTEHSVLIMCAIGMLLLFGIITFKGTAALSCYEGNFDDINYEPGPKDAHVCSPGVTQCISGFIEATDQKSIVQESVFSCDQEFLCQAIANNSCEYETGTMTCCCDEDLCNTGKSFASFLTTVDPSGSPSLYSLTSLLVTFILLK